MKINAWKIILNKTTNFEIKRGLTSFVNPYSMLVLEKKRNIANSIDFWHVDGISLVHLLNYFFSKKLNRFSFDETSLAPAIFNFAKENRLKIGVVGTCEDLISGAVKNLEKKHEVKIDFFRNGFFKDQEELNFCYETIIRNKIEIMICGMGTPKQEDFLIGLKNKGWNGYGFTCGGYLHQSSKKENYYPKIFDNFEVRWIYRILDEPRLFKRYFLKYPLFFMKSGFVLKKLRSERSQNYHDLLLVCFVLFFGIY